ncbi:plasmid replication protein RepC [Sinorhizobium sp. BG8]|uniref:plasmid replication protein RepC n=1 Tax=Sinorhizobium sp. BG8 TaxID=2613773 RepID=UPI001FEFEDC0|nr:plasmid replication protein RepC [Sinorhizobium sp. BG8]
MTVRHFALQERVAKAQERLRDADGGNETGTADKWQLIRALTEARVSFGLSDRTITVLEALLSFHPSKVLDGKEPIIVFPSNAELAVRSRGMAPATLRRHIAALQDAGFLMRRDSPNGKRYCRRNEEGQMEEAFGFDLAPLALMAGTIHESAERARILARKQQALRGEITIYLRDISKIIEAALEEARSGDWLELAQRLTDLSGRVGRTTSIEDLQKRKEGLADLRRLVEREYLNSIPEQEMSANDAHFDHHIQNSKTDLPIELNGQERVNPGDPETKPRPLERKAAPIDLKRVLAACPEVGDYAKDGISTWADMIKVAGLVRSMLGISSDAYDKARAAMGESAAAVVIAAMLQRAEHIRSPGGYLRELTRRAEEGKFSVLPMIKALE